MEKTAQIFEIRFIKLDYYIKTSNIDDQIDTAAFTTKPTDEHLKEAEHIVSEYRTKDEEWNYGGCWTRILDYLKSVRYIRINIDYTHSFKVF